MVGRAQAIARLSSQVPERRLVTIVGAGGIGKTTLALATADRLRTSFPDGVYFVNLVGITDPARVSSAVASAFRQPVLSQNPLPGLAEYLRSKQLLIVLDNCEHVIEAAASLAEPVIALSQIAHEIVMHLSVPPAEIIGLCRTIAQDGLSWLRSDQANVPTELLDTTAGQPRFLRVLSGQ